MSRLPIRARLTAAFALAMVLVLAATATFVYGQVKSDLDESVDHGLRSRADDVAALVRQSGGEVDLLAGGARLADPEESFAQVLTPSGRVVDATSTAAAPALTPDEAAAVSPEGSFFERELPPRRGDGAAARARGRRPRGSLRHRRRVIARRPRRDAGRPA